MDWSSIAALLAAFAAIVSIFTNYKINTKTIRDKIRQEKVAEITHKLDNFYGPLVQLRAISFDLYQVLRASKGDNFRTLDALLTNYKFTSNEMKVIQEILTVSEKINDLIIQHSGFIEDAKLRDFLGKICSHTRVLRYAYDGLITGEKERFADMVFPREVDSLIEQQVQRLLKEKDRINKS